MKSKRKVLEELWDSWVRGGLGSSCRGRGRPWHPTSSPEGHEGGIWGPLSGTRSRKPGQLRWGFGVKPAELFVLVPGRWGITRSLEQERDPIHCTLWEVGSGHQNG